MYRCICVLCTASSHTVSSIYIRITHTIHLHSYRPHHPFTFVSPTTTTTTTHTTTTQGCALFLTGNTLQCHAHYTLGRLQKHMQRVRKPTTATETPKKTTTPKATTTPKETTTIKGSSRVYGVPQGGGFTYVSCPHYLGEIVIYTGLAVGFGWEQPLLWVVLAWVVCGVGRGRLYVGVWERGGVWQ